ncbi:MAG: polyprenyl synthetase family protein [Bacteroidetes bacterium]|nr:polyprenyl synthetase family protein [Bacteroidota bacterium]
MNAFTKTYNTYRALVDQRLHSIVRKAEPASLYEPMKYILSSSGKRIRPILIMLSCKAAGGTAKEALHAATAIEIMHNFTLVHDDIMDHAESRRGKPTVHTKWDENVAILVGDELIAYAYRELLKTESKAISRIADVFTDGVVEVCEGQAYDKEFETVKDITIDDYLLMISKKTGKLFAVSAEIGALIGGATERETRALRSYGNFLGRAFQIQDDLLDITADEKEFGKKIGGDILEGKKTFLLLRAAERAAGKDKKLIENILRKKKISCATIPAVKEIYERYGILELARNAVDRDIRQANIQLEKLRAGTAAEMLYKFSHWVLNRNF